MGGIVSRGVCVWGAGAVGKLVAATLQLSGMDVTLKVRRAEHARQLRQKGITLYRQNATEITVPVQVTDSVSSINSDLVILTVKSFDTLQALHQFAEMQSRPKVLSLQNGLGNGELLAESLPADRIFTGVTTYGATSLSDCEVAARGEGELVVGGWFGDQQLYSNELAKLFAEAGWKVRIGQNMRQEVWKKALVNIGINPVTAIYRVTNGEILQRKELQELASAAVKEAEEAAFAAGILSIENVGHAVSRMLAVCSQTATNHSSMLQDIEKGRRTEIDALNGSIVQLGEACAVNTPVNRELVRQIKTLEQNTSF